MIANDKGEGSIAKNAKKAKDAKKIRLFFASFAFLAFFAILPSPFHLHDTLKR